MDSTILIQKMMDFYTVFTMKELSEKIGISQQAISKWKKNNYIKAIANKCKELGIYDEIFSNPHIAKQEDFFIDIMSYSNINMKKIIKNWGIQGYGIVIGIILYLKEKGTLENKDIDLLADDLKTSAFLIQKVIEDCNFLVQENNKIKLRIEL
ncbi:helix-turn-helix transcriptional regulator [Aliarcobacter butzleri]|uniref:helix-turn-helix transcriptional regulator n=1 Tax=Aliarcobacter butzleri TaxID=28197 RepID=UPI002B24CC0C|nr:helix-turn-helix transcriptional regulator [Aliarcobacter butzleri]